MNNRIFEIIQYMNGQVGLQWEEKDKQELAELIIQECCDIVRQCRFAPDEDAIVNEIVNHFGVDGMSTEDKKTLIKELLGVKNENTNY